MTVNLSSQDVTNHNLTGPETVDCHILDIDAYNTLEKSNHRTDVILGIYNFCQTMKCRMMNKDARKAALG